MGADEKPCSLRFFKDLVGAFWASTGPAASTGEDAAVPDWPGETGHQNRASLHVPICALPVRTVHHKRLQSTAVRDKRMRKDAGRDGRHSCGRA